MIIITVNIIIDDKLNFQITYTQVNEKSPKKIDSLNYVDKKFTIYIHNYIYVYKLP